MKRIVTADSRVRVLVVDDSPTARLALREALRQDPSIEVVGEASHARAALEAAQRLRPDLITMDVYMKGPSGLEATAEIMHTVPTPILVVTGVDPTEPSLVYEAMQAGALEVCGKLPGPSTAAYPARRDELVRLVRCLARVPVVRRRYNSVPPPRAETPRPPRTPAASVAPQLVAVGASTGGPPVVCALLRALPATVKAPVALVQHMAGGFLGGFAEWLEGQTRRRVELIGRRTALEPGVVYLVSF